MPLREGKGGGAPSQSGPLPHWGAQASFRTMPHCWRHFLCSTPPRSGDWGGGWGVGFSYGSTLSTSRGLPGTQTLVNICAWGLWDQLLYVSPYLRVQRPGRDRQTNTCPPPSCPHTSGSQHEGSPLAETARGTGARRGGAVMRFTAS